MLSALLACGLVHFSYLLAAPLAQTLLYTLLNFTKAHCTVLITLLNIRCPAYLKHVQDTLVERLLQEMRSEAKSLTSLGACTRGEMGWCGPCGVRGLGGGGGPRTGTGRARPGTSCRTISDRVWRGLSLRIGGWKTLPRPRLTTRANLPRPVARANLPLGGYLFDARSGPQTPRQRPACTAAPLASPFQPDQRRTSLDEPTSRLKRARPGGFQLSTWFLNC